MNEHKCPKKPKNINIIYEWEQWTLWHSHGKLEVYIVISHCPYCGIKLGGSQ